MVRPGGGGKSSCEEGGLLTGIEDFNGLASLAMVVEEDFLLGLLRVRG